MFLLSILSLVSMLSIGCINTDSVIPSSSKDNILSSEVSNKSYRAFDNDTYTSIVNNKVAYRYYSKDITISYPSSTSQRYMGFVQFGSSTDGYRWTNNWSNRNIVFTMSNVTDFISSQLPFTDSEFYIFSEVGYCYDPGSTSNGSYGLIFRFMANPTSNIKNVEFTLNSLDMPSNRVSFGIGDFAHQNNVSRIYSYIPTLQGKTFLLSDSTSISNNADVFTNEAYLCSFYQYWFFIPFGSTSNTFSLNINLLGSFDQDYQTGYDEGLSIGRVQGDRDGYQRGYEVGYNAGSSIDSHISSIFTGILDIGILPVNVFLSILNFEVFGINIAGIVSGLLTLAIVIIIVRLLTGGKKDD